ncbi:uncharacterized protein LOC109861322, partial [Pseudomyrmex gracilis]|uniref:uncharacterized protein LOC109861322 n=1 Tax=Pseudomyrmex gracilis TaxID=219809 RepID=UPI000995523C
DADNGDDDDDYDNNDDEDADDINDADDENDESDDDGEDERPVIILETEDSIVEISEGEVQYGGGTVNVAQENSSSKQDGTNNERSDDTVDRYIGSSATPATPDSAAERSNSDGITAERYTGSATPATLDSAADDEKRKQIDSMSSEERERFLLWHAEQMRENAGFDFQREIVRYCRNDVDILRRACMAFRKIFLERENVCPFEECTTIASTCMRVSRKNFLREEEIGVIPCGGYCLADTQSRKALQWLVWKERELGRIIVHAGHGREHRLAEVGGIPVDGYYETANGERHVLQYHGCFWHECPVCFKTERDKRLCTGEREVYDTMNLRYERTLTTSWRLRKRRYIVTEKWECAFDRDTRENREMRAFLDQHPMLAAEPLLPRDAFFCGRTGNIAIRREVTGMEKIRYVDVCSLYLYVLKTGAFPIGHPKIFVGQKECASLIGAMPGVDFSAVEGLQTQCSHENPRDREFENVWVSCELRKAVEKGYLVTAQKASGWPSECVDDQSKERYLREYETVEDIALDRANIAQNPGLRSVAKLCLNSFWGKFGQRSNLPSTEVVKLQERLVSLLSSPEHEVTDILPVNDEVIYVLWQMRDEAVIPSSITNVIIAAYTTAQARLKLYEYLERLGERVLYYNTDSCIYVSSGEPGEYEPRTGNFLGNMTDELEGYGRGSYIESFVSGGPKFHAYVVRTLDGGAREVCKIKGITLNSATSRIINFNSVRELLMRRERKVENVSINLHFRAICRTAFHEVVTRDESKICSPVLLKRRFIDERRSVPYGYLE